jgi:hypothetical protein
MFPKGPEKPLEWGFLAGQVDKPYAWEALSWGFPCGF